MKWRRVIPQVLTYVAVIALVITTVAPLLWLFIMSISSTPEMTAVPALVIAFFLQKTLIAGLSAGGVKG